MRHPLNHPSDHLFDLGTLATALGADVSSEVADLACRGISTDTRRLQAGDLFVALVGERFNGHDFLGQAEAQGARAFVLSETRPTDRPVLLVEDTTKALGRLGAVHRLAWSGHLWAVTGSCGKTTVKDMVTCILAARGKNKIVATEKNLNNHLGVPMTLLRLTKEQQFAVVEVGASQPGEIDYSANLAKPNCAIITGVAPAHLGGFGSQTRIAEEKAKLLKHLSADGVAVVPAGSPYDALWRKEAAGRRLIYFDTVYSDNGHSATRDQAQVRIANCRQQRVGIEFDLQTAFERAHFSIPILGLHNCSNAAAAVAAVTAMPEAKFTLAEASAALAHYRPAASRLELHQLMNDGLLIDDSYNANPTSVRAAMQTLAQLPGRRILILGEMLELGARARAAHTSLGDEALRLNLDGLLTCGEMAGLAVQQIETVKGKDAAYQRFEHQDELVAYLHDLDHRGVTYLVKGSRGARMEVVVTALLRGLKR